MKKLFCFLLLLLCVFSCSCAEEKTFYASEDYRYVLLEDGSAQIINYFGSKKHLLIPDSLNDLTITSIGEEVFDYCGSLTSVSIPGSVTSIGYSAFSSCGSLISVSIPDSVAFIGVHSFSSCDALTSVSIPDTVTFIGSYAFSHCPNLTLTVPRDSYARQYAIDNNIPFTYPDALDWLTE